jgi:hypothetical protein
MIGSIRLRSTANSAACAAGDGGVPSTTAQGTRKPVLFSIESASADAELYYRFAARFFAASN